MAPTTALKKLRKKLHKLPQELFDEIKHFTLAFDPESSSRTINSKYKVPFQLHLNHELRQACLPLYYGTPSSWIFEQSYLLESWIRSLSSAAKRALEFAGNESNGCWMAVYSVPLSNNESDKAKNLFDRQESEPFADIKIQDFRTADEPLSVKKFLKFGEIGEEHVMGGISDLRTEQNWYDYKGIARTNQCGYGMEWECECG